MYRLEDLNLGDKVTLDDGEKGIVVCIMTDDYKDEIDVFGNIVIRACVCPHGMNPYVSIEIEGCEYMSYFLGACAARDRKDHTGVIFIEVKEENNG